ncbi:10250_t:CDS:2, partial [Acaulospora colombiana]
MSFSPQNGMPERNSKKRKLNSSKSEDNHKVNKLKQEFTAMTTVIFTSIMSKKQGDDTKYNELVQQIKDYADQKILSPRKVRLWLMAFSRATTMLDVSCSTLVSFVLKLNWTEYDNNLVVIFVMFLANLISSHSDHMPAVLNMLVKNLVF